MAIAKTTLSWTALWLVYGAPHNEFIVMVLATFVVGFVVAWIASLLSHSPLVWILLSVVLTTGFALLVSLFGHQRLLVASPLIHDMVSLSFWGASALAVAFLMRGQLQNAFRVDRRGSPPSPG
jgi:hypothetical protein